MEFIENNYARFPFESLVHDEFNLDTVPEAFAHAIHSPAHRVGVRIAPPRCDADKPPTAD